VKIRKTSDDDRGNILNIHQLAFNENIEAELVDALLTDPSAQPCLSLIALEGDEPIGHILFTKVKVLGYEDVQARILAPLSVIPPYQNHGVGGKLIMEGIKRLKEKGTEIIFVLGYPTYYTRFGFTPAGKQGFEAPYPIPEKNVDAWMLIKLKPIKITGKIKCAKTLDKPEYWKE